MLSQGMHIRYLFVFILVFITRDPLFAQGESDNALRKGNGYYYDKKDYKAAEKSYRKALEYNPKSYQGHLNLGDALYQQGKFEEAEEQFQEALKNTKYEKAIGNTFHNLGNAYLKSGQLDKAIESYKNALKRIPNDADTKYNYSYALAKRKQEQKKQEQQQQSGSKKPGENQQMKKGSGKDKEQKEQGNGKQQPKVEQNPNGQLDPKEMERIMDALRRNENNIRQRINRKNQNEQQNDTRKPW